ncbi:MAG TPA: N-acetylmuramoyl-L-alanine amidase [Thermoanaerobaculia bacterium]|nr:N-acetylmuramoyl-L-alanine amidase [Thermoanaerobaculia bacterium]
MPDPKTYHFTLPAYSGPPLAMPPAKVFPGVDGVVQKSSRDRKARGDGIIRAIVIHATAGSTSSGAMSNTFAGKSSFHYLVPGERDAEHGSTIFRCIPEERAAWHVRNDASHPSVNGGSRLVNYWSIGIEIVNVGKSSDPYSAWQLAQAAALVRHLWSKHRTITEVVSHAKLDPSRRTDPGSHFPWSSFRDAVLAPAPETMELATAVAVSAGAPVRILGPRGAEIDCDPVLLDGATVAEVRPLVEALGFAIEYDRETPMTMKIVRRKRA